MPKMSPYKRAAFASRNKRKLCSASGCGKLRHYTHAHCLNCRKRLTRYGHPSGRKILRTELEPYERQVGEVLDQFPDHPATVVAHREMEQLITRPESLGLLPQLVIRELWRLNGGGLKAREALERVGGVYLFAQAHPNVLPCRARFEFAVANTLLLARRLERRVTHGPTSSVVRSRQVGKLARESLGRHVCSHYAGFFSNVMNHLSERFKAQQETVTSLLAPFPND